MSDTFPVIPPVALRRSAAELLAVVVTDLFPDVVLVGGGEISFGFYYDFLFAQSLPAHMLDLLEVNLRALTKQQPELRTLSITRENARDYFHYHHQPILAEQALLKPTNLISLLQVGEFWGLADEPHADSTQNMKNIRLLGMESSRRVIPEMGVVEVTRIQGVVFEDSRSLKLFNKAYDWLKQGDHRLIGRELGLFDIVEKISHSEPVWYPKGVALRAALLKLCEKKDEKQKSVSIQTPSVVKSLIAKGYRSFPCFTLESQEEYTLAPDLTLSHMEAFKQVASKSPLPIRWTESKVVYREEDSVQTWGLLSSCAEMRDQTTIFCLEEQLLKEMISSLLFILETFRILGFEARWVLLVPPESKSKSGHNQKEVDRFKEALEACDLSYRLERREKESNKKQGPRLEGRLIDRLGREWPGPALECFHFPSMPVVLSQTTFGSLDRVIALLLEKTEGHLPLWLAPEQVRVVCVGHQPSSYAAEVAQALKRQGLRVQLDVSDEKLGNKIHAAERERVPYIVIIGEQEWKKKFITVRSEHHRKENRQISLEQFIELVQKANGEGRANQTLIEETKS